MLPIIGKPIDELVSLINSSNTMPVALTSDDLRIGKPVPVSGTNRVKLPMVAMYDSLYEGYVDVEMRRINFAQAFGTTIPRIAAAGGNSLYDLLDRINKKVGLQLFPEDIEDINLNWVGSNEQLYINVRAKADSLGYENYFTIHYTKLRPLINTVVRNNELDVLSFPVPPEEGKVALQLLTWGIDFSPWSGTLTINSLGRWNPNAIPLVAELMASLGIPNWPTATNGQCKQYQTVNRPESNQKYQYLIIQSGVNLPGYKGDAYFHFNR